MKSNLKCFNFWQKYFGEIPFISWQNSHRSEKCSSKETKSGACMTWPMHVYGHYSQRLYNTHSKTMQMHKITKMGCTAIQNNLRKAVKTLRYNFHMKQLGLNFSWIPLLTSKTWKKYHHLLSLSEVPSKLCHIPDSLLPSNLQFLFSIKNSQNWQPQPVS